MSILAVVLAAAAMQGAPDAQPAATAPAAAAQAQQAKPEPKLVCHMEELVGSRFKKKVCLSEDEQKLQELNNQRLDTMPGQLLSGSLR